MVWKLFVILLLLWALGLVSGYTLGGFIHLLLVVALLVVLIRVIQGKPPIEPEEKPFKGELYRSPFPFHYRRPISN